jgi:hypothetical protein
MSYALGPVVGNSLRGHNEHHPKPHLRQRLVELSVRTAPLGLVTCSEGRLSFAPNYILAAAQQARQAAPLPDGLGADWKTFGSISNGSRVAIQCTPEQLQAIGVSEVCAKRIAGKTGEVAHLGTSNSGVRFADGLWLVLPNHFLTPLPAFDPFTESLAVGDYVEVIHQGILMSGKRGHVIGSGDSWALLYDDGRTDHDLGSDGYCKRSSLKLLRKHADTKSA